MELRHLQTFVATAEHRGFTRAAEALSITQAAVSQQVAALEKELGVRLFERTSRSIAITPAGQRLYDCARKIFDLIDQVREELGGAAAAIGGTLRIAASTVPAQTLLPELLARFRELYPEVRESIVVSDSIEAIRQVEQGSADVGVVGELPHGSRLAAWPIAADELVLAVGPSHRLAGKKRIGVEQLGGEPMIVRESGSGSRHCVERALQVAGLSPSDLNVTMEMNSNDAIRAAVEHGLAAAFLSRASIAKELAERRLIEVAVKNVSPKRQLYLVTDPDRRPTAAARALVEFVERATGGSRVADGGFGKFT